jgi:Flp pilus assembly protein TadB
VQGVKQNATNSLRASIAELLDELLTFISFIIAMFAGLYFTSWWIFFVALLVGFGLARLCRKLLLKNEDKTHPS